MELQSSMRIKSGMQHSIATPAFLVLLNYSIRFHFPPFEAGSNVVIYPFLNMIDTRIKFLVTYENQIIRLSMILGAINKR